MIERARRGDAAAYEELVRRYQDLAFRVAYLITGSAPEAEDAAQEGFVRAYRALGRFRAGAPFRPWLLTIVANAARNRRTAAARHPTDDRRVIVCRYFLDLSEAETADALGCARGTVKSRLSRALGRLRQQLATPRPMPGDAAASAGTTGVADG